MRFDPIGGMQNHAAALTRALDRRGVIQTVVTTRPPTAHLFERFGDHSHVIRLGLPVRRFRQLYGLQACVIALSSPPRPTSCMSTSVRTWPSSL